MERNHINGEHGVFAKFGNKIKTLHSVVLAVFLVLAVSLTMSPYAQAQGVNNAANTLKVTPVRSDIQILPGQSKSVEVVVTNLTPDPITVRPIENDFTAGDERGTPALILDADKYAPTHSLKRFMSPLLDVTIPGNESKSVNVVITVPKDAQAGGYFGALRLAPTSPDGGGQVNLSASVASLILLTVPGDMVQRLEMTDFTVLQNGKGGAFFNTPKDILATVRFENKGNVQIPPTGVVAVKQGDKVIYETEFNQEDPKDMVLPDTARRWDIPLDKIGDFGHFTVIGVFTYGTSNQTIEISQSFWVIPLWMVITALVVGGILLLAIIFLIIFFTTRKKRRARSRGLGNGHIRRRR